MAKKKAVKRQLLAKAAAAGSKGGAGRAGRLSLSQLKSLDLLIDQMANARAITAGIDVGFWDDIVDVIDEVVDFTKDVVEHVTPETPVLTPEITPEITPVTVILLTMRDDRKRQEFVSAVKRLGKFPSLEDLVALRARYGRS